MKFLARAASTRRAAPFAFSNQDIRAGRRPARTVIRNGFRRGSGVLRSNTATKHSFRWALNLLGLLVVIVGAPRAVAEPIDILFVGNSFTFGRAAPVLQYNYQNVTDLNYANWLNNMSGSNADEPHPWGGIPGIFKQFTVEAGLDYNVQLSARNAATLRGHYLNTNGVWDLRANIASQTWDIVVLQENSTSPIPSNRGGSLSDFNTYATKLEKWIHTGASESFKEPGSNTTRNIPANPHASAATRVYLYETWTRPDMAYVAGGAYFGQPIETMANDLHDAYYAEAQADGHFAGVAPVGDAFIRAVLEGIATRNPYNPDLDKLDLWYSADHFHPSIYGSYLSALVQFATITGLDPLSLGTDEIAALDLGIAPDDAVALQRIAHEQVFGDELPLPEPSTALLLGCAIPALVAARRQLVRRHPLRWVRRGPALG